MKVLVINGSPHLSGCTDRALREVERTLADNGIEVERVDIGTKDIRGCIGCNYCRQHGRCVFNDAVNETAPKLAEADGLIVGSPVYYAGCNGQALSFLDRLFYSTSGTVDKTMKVGASCRFDISIRRDQQILHHKRHADRFKHVLERSAWLHGRGCGGRSRRIADYA